MPKLYGKIQYNDNVWVVSNLSPNVSIRFKQLFQGARKSSTGPFPICDTLDNASDLLWFSQRYPMEISKTDLLKMKKVNRQHHQLIEKTEQMLSPSYEAKVRPGLMPGQYHRDYQLTGLDFIDATKSALLIDDVGLGKTYEGLGIGLLEGALPLVIVCQPHLQEQWADKAKSFINLSVHKLKGNTPYPLPAADIYIVKYTQLSPWVDILCAGWVKSIAFDEVQELRRGDDSNKGLAAKNICANINIRVGLTATLIYNYGIEAWNIINIIRPGLLGSKDEFTREWCAFSGVVKDPNALGTYLRETQLILRRTKKDVGQTSKQTKPHIEWLPHSQELIKDTEELTKSLAMTTLRGSFSESGRASREFDMRMRMMTGISKAPYVAAYVRMLVESGKPVLLFGWHHEVYNIWREALKDLNPLFYTGNETAAQKEKNKKAFIDGHSNLLIMSLRSGAGVDGLQARCNHVIFGEIDWSPKVHVQCIGRADRDDQDKDVFVMYAVTKFGSDPVMIDVLGVKHSQGKGIEDPGAEDIIHKVDPHRIKRVAEAYLKEKGVKLELGQDCVEQNQDDNVDIKQIALSL
jgi:SNF2 family DNA or RNA helicase